MTKSGRLYTGARYSKVDEFEVDDDSPGRIFVEKLQKNPEVCSNCFLKIRDVVLPWSWKINVRKGLVRIYVSKANRVEKANHPSDQARNPPNACANCGSISGSTMRPLPKDRAVEYAWNLSQTLGELDVAHDPLLLAFVVAYRKQFPRFGSNDDDTYRVAVEYAIDATDHSIADVFATGPDNPAWTGDDPIVELPALPEADLDGRPDRAHHGRPALFESCDE